MHYRASGGKQMTMQIKWSARTVPVLIALGSMVILLAGSTHGLGHSAASGTDPSKHASPLEVARYCPQKCTCQSAEEEAPGSLQALCSGQALRTLPNDISPQVTSLDLSGNKIHSLNSTQLEASNDLTSIKTITDGTNVRHLNLHQNLLPKLDLNSFHSFPVLQTLDLSDNLIYAIHANTFQNLEVLSVLNLSGNHLDTLKHEWFQNLGNLTVLDLSHNWIKELNNVVFWSLHRLVHLRIDHNRIDSVGLLSLKGLKSLRTFNISWNEIPVIQSGTLRATENLEVLDVSHNPIRSLQLVFRHAHNLRRLYASHLRMLSHLTRESFEGLDQVEQLFMTDCARLETVDPGALEPLGNLRMLDWRFNNFTTLPSGLFHPVIRIERVQLHGNPWYCDCRLYWLLLWLRDNTAAHLLSPSTTICSKPFNLTGLTVLDAVDKHMVCINATVLHYTTQAHFRLGSSALLKCDVSGSPEPSITWVTPHRHVFNWTAEYGASVGNTSVDSLAAPGDSSKFVLLQSGNLFVREVQRGDSGYYRCTATNVLSRHTVAIRLTLDYDFLVHTKIISILVGCATALAFVLVTMVSILINSILWRFGVACPCDVSGNSPRAKQLYQMLESLESYRCQQLERLRENYTSQVQRIKENCIQQMEKLRESYSGQTERLRDICDYGTAHIAGLRDNYYSQVQRVRDYGVSQIDRLRENYVFQRNRICKFSTHHLYKLRENYKLQQQHLNKILENLNLESCRSVCARTDSIMFDPADLGLMSPPALDMLPPPPPMFPLFLDQLDNESQLSAYYTPDNISQVSDDEITLQPHFGAEYLDPGVFPIATTSCAAASEITVHLEDPPSDNTRQKPADTSHETQV